MTDETIKAVRVEAMMMSGSTFVDDETDSEVPRHRLREYLWGVVDKLPLQGRPGQP